MEKPEHGRIIVISDEHGNVEVWGSLVEICKEHGISYNYLKKFKYPFEYRGVNFRRLNFRSKPITGHVKFNEK